MTRSTERLLDCLRNEPATARRACLRHYSAADWRAIAPVAERQGVGPLLYHAIRHHSHGLALSRDLEEELRRKYYVAAARNMRLYHELQRILGLLAARGIAVIVLKGAHLADAAYGNIALRPMGDVDLLLSEDDLKLAEACFLEAGAQPVEHNRVITAHNSHFGYIMADSELRVEIHWRLFPPDYACKIDHSGIWSRAQPLRLAQAEVLALAQEDLLIHVCVHAAKHVPNTSLRMLYDIMQLTSKPEGQFDWQVLSTRARQWGAGRAVYALLRLARELLGAAVCEEHLEALRPAEFDEQKFLLIQQHMLGIDDDDRGTEAWEPGAQWRRARGLRGKILWLLHQAFPSRSQMALEYPAPADSWRIVLYYPVRLKHLVFKHGRTTWAMARGDVRTRIATDRRGELLSLRDWLVSG